MYLINSTKSNTVILIIFLLKLEVIKIVQYFFVTALDDITIDTVLSKGRKFNTNLRLSNDTGIISKNINDLERSLMGELEYSHLLNKPFVYSIATFPDNIFDDDELAMNLLNDFLEKVQLLLTEFWFSTDNSINTDKGYLFLRSKFGSKVHSLGRSVSFYNHKGNKEIVIINHSTLNTVIKRINHMNQRPTLGVDKNEYMEEIINLPRVDKAIFLLQYARSQYFLPDRITAFVTILESLLSSSTTEVTHKLKENVAWILGNNFEERKEIFNKVDEFYKVRSANIHGGSLSSKQTYRDLSSLSNTIELYVRQILMKIFEDPALFKLFQRKSSNKQFKNYITTLILGGDSKELL